MNRPTSSLPLPALVIPDVHHRFEWAENIIARDGADCASIIFTGDYFDDHGDTPQDTYHTARWLKNSLRDPRRYHLLGNHDVGYFASGRQNMYWSGWSEEKHEVFSQFFKQDEFPSLPLYLAVQAGPWLLSHAGFCGGRHSAVTGYPTQLLLHWAQQARMDLKYHMQQIKNPPKLIDCGYARGGDRPVGGLFWCDFDREFVPLVGRHQICGHTPDKVRGCMLMPGGQVRTVHMRELTQDAANRLGQNNIRSQNWCIDTHGHSWAKIYDTHLHLAWDEQRVDVPSPIVEEPTWPLLTEYNLVPPISNEPPLRVSWEMLRQRFTDAETWAHLLRALHLPENPELAPSAPELENALRLLQKKENLPPLTGK